MPTRARDTIYARAYGTRNVECVYTFCCVRYLWRKTMPAMAFVCVCVSEDRQWRTTSVIILFCL